MIVQIPMIPLCSKTKYSQERRKIYDPKLYGTQWIMTKQNYY
jgi:hypothetical protein